MNGEQASARRTGSSSWATQAVAWEFLAAAVLMLASVFLVSTEYQQEARKKYGPATPTSRMLPLGRLSALCGVFIVLAMLSSGRKAGRIAAAFGGLVLSGVAFNERDVFVSLAEIFPPPKK
ncbi:hypothetical protein [Amycolatopsis alkalitolerans]|uniref:Uncharacterized protein n=1 Tax=Amycolatopsis alkalitolerans TaxID=2547244 RepID=A0A5C4LS45_9PSEU|nr:hypothetical protein [Amycolatopsis alkalitolerans]TNC19070.1 hypothetical protein FG385_32915 [Amycolatopsis alkalitolerans]